MPEVSRFRGIVIQMYYDEYSHELPHFHARYAEYKASFSIESPSILAGDMPGKQHNLIVEWANQHREELLENWNRARAGQELRKIPGL